MRRLVPILLIFLLMASVVQAGKVHRTYHYDRDDDMVVRLDMEDDDIILEHKRFDDPRVVITKDHELLIDGKKVDLTADQQEMVAEYYKLVADVKEIGLDIGWEGAKIGLEGAKLGAKAVGRVLKMIFTRYSEDDLEYDMDRDAELIEEKAERLEKKAEYIEELAMDLEDLTYEMFDEIDELKELEWF
jgi:hypothetical protein